MQDVHLDALQPLLGDAVARRLDAEGDVARLFQAVVALGELGLQHLGVFAPDLVEIVAARRHDNTLFQRVVPAVEIMEGELKSNRRVEVVQKVAPALEDGGLVLVLRKLVVDVLKADGLGVERVAHAADPIRPHPLIGDAVLRGRGLLALSAARPTNGGVDLFALPAGEGLRGGFSVQCSAPPDLILPAAAIRRRSYWFGMAAPAGGESASRRCFLGSARRAYRSFRTSRRGKTAS
ncbi:hypothetical protein SDC9_126704 [bioreactor metagenome]|uniref:Uncharacterized protein n=1 Tax=bioreactor metagenome TaxID=1076179 RepID=A0A645CRZ0_9ZZZZ